MTILETYFLVLVCGAFGIFSLGLILGTMREKAYTRALARRNSGLHD